MRCDFGRAGFVWATYAAATATAAGKALGHGVYNEANSYLQTAFCLPTGDETAINEALASGGAGAQVALCPGAHFSLRAPIVFTAPAQSVYTSMGINGRSSPARLQVMSSGQSAAIVSDCDSCRSPSLRHLEVDGHRRKLGSLRDGQSLIYFGRGAADALIDRVHAWDPRGGNAIEVEGHPTKCFDVRITNSRVGPVGSVDAAANGIAVRCAGSWVRSNYLIDISGVAIHLTDSPASQVENNTIVAMKQPMQCGIDVLVGSGSALVPIPPRLALDAHRTSPARRQRIDRNTIVSGGPYIGAGLFVTDVRELATKWWRRPIARKRQESVLVTANSILGQEMGHGIIVSARYQVVASGNAASGFFRGANTAECPVAAPASRLAFVAKGGNADNTLQREFVRGTFTPTGCFRATRSHVEF